MKAAMAAFLISLLMGLLVAEQEAAWRKYGACLSSSDPPLALV
jgi:hypothetical protein